jgi:hypothetical protein
MIFRGLPFSFYRKWEFCCHDCGKPCLLVASLDRCDCSCKLLSVIRICSLWRLSSYKTFKNIFLWSHLQYWIDMVKRESKTRFHLSVLECWFQLHQRDNNRVRICVEPIFLHQIKCSANREKAWLNWSQITTFASQIHDTISSTRIGFDNHSVESCQNVTPAVT